MPMHQKTVQFSDGRKVTFTGHSKEAAELRASMAKLSDPGRNRKAYSQACGCLNVCRNKRTGRFVKRKGRK
jgi:hypothetical protein